MKKHVLANTKQYRRRMHIFWWTNRWMHIKFIARELTSICVATYAILFLFFVRAVMQGPAAYEAYIERMKSPWLVAVHILLLGGLIFHSITWFNLAPKAMVVKVGKNYVPGVMIALANYAGWVVISAVLAWLILNGI